MNKETHYKETNSNKRATDDISFKLIGLVPLTTLLSFIGIFFKDIDTWLLWFYLLGVIGALIVFGIFRWELRNIQNCNKYDSIIKLLEQELEISPLQKKEKPKLLGLAIGKTEAEKIIYTTLIVAWLLLPFMLRGAIIEDFHFGVWDYVYIGFCVLILIFTGASVASKI